LTKVASMAALQKSGARGLRAILERAVLDIMYHTAGQSINEVIINEDVIEKHAAPLITFAKESTKSAEAETPITGCAGVVQRFCGRENVDLSGVGFLQPPAGSSTQGWTPRRTCH